MKLSDLDVPEISSIYSLEFDNYGNNLYWCDRTRKTLDVLSLSTKTHTTIFKEIEGHIPFAVTLVPDKRQVHLILLYNIHNVLRGRRTRICCLHLILVQILRSADHFHLVYFKIRVN